MVISQNFKQLIPGGGKLPSARWAASFPTTFAAYLFRKFLLRR
jgi:hypothetical protein